MAKKQETHQRAIGFRIGRKSRGLKGLPGSPQRTVTKLDLKQPENGSLFRDELWPPDGLSIAKTSSLPENGSTGNP